MLEILKAVRIGRRNPLVGICGNLYGLDYLDFLDLAKKWPKHSGERRCPIPGGIKAYEMHRERGTLWQGEQLQLRLELLDFVIGELEMKSLLENLTAIRAGKRDETTGICDNLPTDQVIPFVACSALA